MKKDYILAIALFCMAIIPLSAQVENLLVDSVFFERQKAEYQEWLEFTGFGDFLQVRDLLVEQERVRLYLGFHVSNADTVKAIWDNLKYAHDLKMGDRLEETLFFRMCQLMNLQEEAAVLGIFDTYDSTQPTLFSRSIYFEDERVKVHDNNPKHKNNFPILIKVSLNQDSGRRGGCSFTQNYSREYVFDKIIQFARQKYTRPRCDLRSPAVHPKPHDEYLRFEVRDLCREVIGEAENPIICRWLNSLGYNCNWTAREKLFFTFIYTKTEEGFTLHLTLEGQVGSGYYEDVKRQGYINMRADFNQELDDYTEQLVSEIKNYLRK